MRKIFVWLIFLSSPTCYGQGFLDKGKSYINASAYNLAQEHFRNQLDSCQNTCHDTTVAYLNVFLAKSLQLLNKYDTAFACYIRGLELFQQEQNENGEVFALVSLGEFYRNLHEYNKAKSYLDMAENIHENNSLSNANIAYLYNRLAAVVSESTFDYEKVIFYSNEVIKIAVEMGDRDLEASSLNELGFVYEKLRDTLAIEYFIRSYNIYQELGNPRYAVSVLTNLGRSLCQFKQHQRSLVFLNQGIQLAEGKSWDNAMPDLYYYQYLNYHAIELTDLALEAYTAYHRAFLKARELDWNKSLYQMETKIELAEKEKILANVKHKETIAKLDSEQKGKQLKNLMIVGVLLLIICALLYWAYEKSIRTNKLLNDGMAQKEILMQEVHHRVKNNLTFLKSLLYLRSSATDDRDVKMILDECQSRIQSMALVHQNLYDIDNASEVDFHVFLKELFMELESMFHKDHTDVDIDIDVSGIKIDMKRSVFLGLILNELITNSFKYAFDDLPVKKIGVMFSDTGSALKLSYFDNGHGFPEGFDMHQTSGFGFKLINILLSQINADMSYSQNSLNTFTVTIPK